MTDGAPVHTSNKPWTLDRKDECFERGCHQSAVEHSKFLRDKLANFIDNKFWMVLPCALVRELENLQLSPAGVKPERDRRPRLVGDHSWFPVNDLTLPNVLKEAMQFGRALQRLLHASRHAHLRYVPVFLSKHDLKDGFHRLFLRATNV